MEFLTNGTVEKGEQKTQISIQMLLLTAVGTAAAVLKRRI
jgi:hypothetical protein